mmetsp:Transcript_6983/g.9125  ORF Transcript_6983/g.9125 Transcript_6983/m.9125 type:complete len:331 (+) Transcript_6983:98-1090(+)
MSTEKLERVLLQRENSILGSIYSAGEDEAFTQLLAVSEQARKKNQVPKLIHKIWWQGLEELPEKYTHPLSTWRSINPDWTVIVWSEKSIFLMMEQFFPRYVKMMNDYTYMIQKIDAAKYFFLEVFGGIYSDMDQICINRIEKICDAETEKADIVCSLLTEDKTLIVLSSAFTYKDGPFCNNAFCISKPRAEAWQHIRQVLVKKRVANRLHMKEAQVLNTTGPCVFTAGIRSAIAFEKDLTGSNEIDSIRLLESKFIDPFSIYFKLGKKKEFNDLIDKILEEDEALCISFIASSWTNVSTCVHLDISIPPSLQTGTSHKIFILRTTYIIVL